MQSVVECNLYQYAGNSPLVMLDLSGLEAMYALEQEHSMGLNAFDWSAGASRLQNDDRRNLEKLFSSIITKIEDPAIATKMAFKIINSYPIENREDARGLFINTHVYLISPEEEKLFRTRKFYVFGSGEASRPNSYLSDMGKGADSEFVDTKVFKSYPVTGVALLAWDVNKTSMSSMNEAELSYYVAKNAAGFIPGGWALGVAMDFAKDGIQNRINEQGGNVQGWVENTNSAFSNYSVGGF